MGQHLTTNGQEQLSTDNLDGATVRVGLYDDSTDDVPLDGTLADVTTEPNVTREQTTLSLTTTNGFVELTGATVTFDVTNASATVDSYFFVRDPGSGDELIVTGLLEQSRDLSQIDELDVTDTGTEFTTPA